MEIRSKEEILQTLDSRGMLDGMPFMPEMFQYCGQRFRVYKRAHKTCDTVYPVRGRRLERAVHLETRCSGEAHGGCHCQCLLFWKEAWLKPVSKACVETTIGQQGGAGCPEAAVYANAQSVGDDGQSRYVCQATQLPYATTDLSPWDIRQYIEDYRSGNAGWGRILAGATYRFTYMLSQSGVGLGRPLRYLYDRLCWVWGGPPFPERTGVIPAGQPTPQKTLNLQPGELVRVKPYKEILKTLDTASRNRGLLWGSEMVPYCEKTYRVLSRVERVMNERTGIVRSVPGASVILEDVTCQSRYSSCRMFCPRNIYPYWREIWLERVTDASAGEDSAGRSATA